MNTDRMTQLRDFLAAGTPGFEFDIRRGYSLDVPGGCIAGAAYHLFCNPEQTDIEDIADDLTSEVSWSVVRDAVMEVLGLEETSYRPLQHHLYVGHDLFRSDLCPKPCTSTHAAAAVQRTIDGEFPWLI